jgi:hypothetical protein
VLPRVVWFDSWKKFPTTSLPVQPPECQPDLGQALQHLRDFLGEHQAGEVDEHRGSQPGAHVGRARGKITEFGVKCESKSLSQFSVQPIHLGVHRLQREARMEALNAEMVLLVEHHPDPVLDQHRGARTHPSVRIQPRQLLAHEMPLVQQLPLGAVEPVEPELGRVAQEYRLPSRPLDGGQDVLPLRLGGASLEHAPRQVPREPDPGGEHQVTGGAAGI